MVDALLQPAPAESPSAENGDDAEANEERLRRLCQCLASRSRLRSALNPTLRDVLISHLKKAVRVHAKRLLQENGGGTQGSGLAVSIQDEEEAAEENPAASPRQDRQDPDVEKSPAADTAEAPAQSPKSGEPGGATSGTSVSTALCGLSFESFLEFWQKLLEFILSTATRMSDYSLRIHSVAQEANAQHGPEDIAGELQRLQEVTVLQAYKIASALLQARKAEHQGLKMADWKVFLASTQTMLEQVQKTQHHCYQKMKLGDGAGSVDVHAGLRATMNTQTKSIIEEFHQKCLLQTKQVLEQERWARTDVPAQYRRIVHRLLGAEDLSAEQGEGSPEAEEGLTPVSVERYLHVEGTHYLVVPAVLTLVQLLGDYVGLCHDFSEMMAEVVQRMCQLLRLFNQRAQRLVLNGQAVQHKVLPKITAANLALCSQSCGVVAQLLPLLQARLNEISRGTHDKARGAMVAALLSDLSKIASEFSEHRTALFGKLSDLLKNAYEKHAKQWLGAPHGQQGDGSLWKGDDAVVKLQRSESSLREHEALEGLVKDITAMYRVLLRNLNYDSVRKIFARAFEDMASLFLQRLEQEIAAPSPPYSDGVGCSLGDRLLLDFAYLNTELEKLTGITTPLERLVCDLIQHLLTKLPEDALRKPHPIVLEVLRSAGRLPK
ncbi:VPS54 [Symbiodinium natans]|uniref:VPS54 protein n=1 Tax=Symbiodinium natans TaxID=878477 RepID=A0A812L8L8_9DINO|nr:VPS54 [Symbiodinium natans]